MKLRNICFVLAAAAGVAAPAMADVVDLGTVYSTGVSSQVGWASGDTLAQTYQFSLSSDNTTLDYTLHDVDVTNLKMNIYKVDGNSLLSVKSVKSVNGGSDRGSELTGLSSGLYQITLTGQSIADYGQPGGGYKLSLTSNVAAPVPGPAGALVAAAGAAVIAFRMRRSRRLAVA